MKSATPITPVKHQIECSMNETKFLVKLKQILSEKEKKKRKRK